MEVVERVFEHREYDAFGNITDVRDDSGTQKDFDAIDSVFGFAGREWDVDTELSYNRARWLDPLVGRFLSEDPLGLAAGDANFYRYAAGDPVNFTDPSGLFLDKVFREVKRIGNQIADFVDDDLDQFGHNVDDYVNANGGWPLFIGRYAAAAAVYTIAGPYVATIFSAVVSGGVQINPQSGSLETEIFRFQSRDDFALFIGDVPIGDSLGSGSSSAGSGGGGLFASFLGAITGSVIAAGVELVIGAVTWDDTNQSSGPTNAPARSDRAAYFDKRIAEELAAGNELEADYVRQQRDYEFASRYGIHPVHASMNQMQIQVERNAAATHRALARAQAIVEYPQRLVLGAVGTTPEELANAAALAGGNAYVPGNELVEIAPGVYQQPMVFAPEQHPNYWKYRLGTDIVTDPLTYVGVGGVTKLRAVQGGRYVDDAFRFGDRAVSVPGTAAEPTRIYSARELLRRSAEPGPFHNFPESFNADIFRGTRTVVSPNYVTYTKPGTITLPGKPIFDTRGVRIGEGQARIVEGVYEIGIRPSASGRTEVIIHRFFRPNAN
jgi:RHS repeat-associated protein